MPDLIAEFGQSHQGKLSLALEQVDATAEAGWQWYKTQLFDPDELCGPTASRYWATWLGGEESQAQTFKANGMLTLEELAVVKERCEYVGVGFLCTPFTLRAVDQLEELGVDAYKVASADLTFHALHRKVARTGKLAFVSTGAGTLLEVHRALDHYDYENVVPLVCTLSYPTADQDAHLRRIETVRKLTRVVGYSDHTTDLDTGLAAAAMGYAYLEKHCTITPNTHVPDDQMAIWDVGHMRYYAHQAAKGYAFRGTHHLVPFPQEEAARQQARRSAHAAVDLKPGDVLSEDNVLWKRPGADQYAFAPDMEDALYGRVARTCVPAGLQILDSDVS